MYTINVAQVLLNFINFVLGSSRPFTKVRGYFLTLKKKTGALNIYHLYGFNVKFSQNHRCKECGMLSRNQLDLRILVKASTHV